MIDAKATIGRHDANDWTIAPAEPPASLQAQAPKLWARLFQAPVMGAAKRYQDADKAAAAAQTTFKRTARRANQAILGVGCLGALTASVGALDGVLEGSTSIIVFSCGVLSIVIGGLATTWLFRIQEGKLLEEWMKCRARAETARIEYFDRMAAPVAGDVELAMLQLEYFRRYQLEVQLAFYRGRGAQHKAAATRTLDARTNAVLLGTIANGLAGFLGSKALPFSALGAGGVIAAAVGAFATSAGATSQDARNAERYARTWETLGRVGERLDDVRAAVENGHLDVLAAFVKAVNEEISLEHRQWLAEEERYAGAIRDLDGKLKELRTPSATTGLAQRSGS